MPAHFKRFDIMLPCEITDSSFHWCYTACCQLGYVWVDFVPLLQAGPKIEMISRTFGIKSAVNPVIAYIFKLFKMLPHVSVSGTCRCEHITPVLRPLHWIPVRQCIEFKMAVLVYKALNGLSPQYLVDDCQLITTTGRRRPRSSNVATCDVPRTRTTLWDRSFTATGSLLWNNLPLHLRDFKLSLFQFRRLLKTHLFDWRSQRPVTYLDIVRFTNVLTYLLTYLLISYLKMKRLNINLQIFHRRRRRKRRRRNGEYIDRSEWRPEWLHAAVDCCWRCWADETRRSSRRTQSQPPTFPWTPEHTSQLEPRHGSNSSGSDPKRLRGTVVERRSLTGELSLSHARPVADGWPLMWVRCQL